MTKALRAGNIGILVVAMLAAMGPHLARGQTAPGKFTPPIELPKGRLGDMVEYGRQVFDHTQTVAKAYVGAGLTCENCHLDSGRLENSAPMWAAYVAYPQFRSKTGRVDTIEDRIQDCFRFSMNGKPPPPDSKELTGLVSYFYWLATGAPVGHKLKGAGYPRLPKLSTAPDPTHGAAVYAANCALCHGAEGGGQKAGGQYVFPPLWGDKSFNWGAGMHVVATAAGFIKANMPLGEGGRLSDKDAWDVAAYVDSRPRPQDPRYVGDLNETRRKYHEDPGGDYYGATVDGVVLGSSSAPAQ